VNVAPFDVRLPEGNEADDDVITVVQPDIIVLRKRPKLDARGCRGASDLIIEVLARAIAPMISKLGAYERHRVKEYWLVHTTDRMVSMHTRTDGGYGRPAYPSMKANLLQRFRR
jgi:Uma2 family endonuclease